MPLVGGAYGRGRGMPPPRGLRGALPAGGARGAAERGDGRPSPHSGCPVRGGPYPGPRLLLVPSQLRPGWAPTPAPCPGPSLPARIPTPKGVRFSTGHTGIPPFSLPRPGGLRLGAAGASPSSAAGPAFPHGKRCTERRERATRSAPCKGA